MRNQRSLCSIRALTRENFITTRAIVTPGIAALGNRQGCIKLLDFSLSSIGWRRGVGRGGAFLLVSPLLGPLPTRSSWGEDGELDAALPETCRAFLQKFSSNIGEVILVTAAAPRHGQFVVFAGSHGFSSRKKRLPGSGPRIVTLLVPIVLTGRTDNGHVGASASKSMECSVKPAAETGQVSFRIAPTGTRITPPGSKATLGTQLSSVLKSSARSVPASVTDTPENTADWPMFAAVLGMMPMYTAADWSKALSTSSPNVPLLVVPSGARIVAVVPSNVMLQVPRMVGVTKVVTSGPLRMLEPGAATL